MTKNPRGFRPHNLRSLLRKPVHFFAFGLGSGLIHPAPGTWGTLAGTLIYIPLSYCLTTPLISTVFLLCSFIIGCWLCGKTAKDLGVHDFGEIVWDEFVGVWIVLAYFPPLLWHKWGAWAGYILAFCLFRLFDILKPQPIKTVDKHAPGGFGIMIDDVLAAGFALALLWGVAFFLIT